MKSPWSFWCTDVSFFFKAEDGIRDLVGTGVQSCVFFFSSRRRHTRSDRDWSSDVCSSDLILDAFGEEITERGEVVWLDRPFNPFTEDARRPPTLRVAPLEVGRVLRNRQIGRASCRERV